MSQNKSQHPINWLVPIILLFTVPPVGIILLVFRFISLAAQQVNQKNPDGSYRSIEDRIKDSIQKASTPRENVVKPHGMDFSHDHEPTDRNIYNTRSRSKKTEKFETEVMVRCPICKANNFVTHLPSECEYCGNQIVKL